MRSAGTPRARRLLAHADEQDRLAGDVAHRECCAAAGVAVGLGEHDAVRSRTAPNARAAFTASWPAMLSTTNSVSTGFTSAASARTSSINRLVDVQAPAVSTSSTS